MNYFVTVRRREVGLRLALGALRSQMVTHFLLQGLAISFIGCLAGSCLVLAFVRTLSGTLYGASTTDAETLLCVVFLVISVAALSSLLPAIRAAHLEPIEVLRDE